jgi:hypothetical protein
MLIVVQSIALLGQSRHVSDPAVNLGDTSYLDALGGPGFVVEQIGDWAHEGTITDSAGNPVPDASAVNSISGLTHIAWLSPKHFLGAWYAGRRVYIHIPISGGDMLNDTLLGFQTLAETAAEKSLVVWINEYFGEIEREGKTIDQMQVFLENRDKVLTSIGIPQRSPDLYGSDIRHMRERKLTFEEAISADLDFNIVEKWRLNRVRRELFEQLAQTPFA